MAETVDFLFVNKFSTPDPKPHRDAKNTTAIQRFVQKGRRRTHKPKLVSSFQARAFEKSSTLKKNLDDLDDDSSDRRLRTHKAQRPQSTLVVDSSGANSGMCCNLKLGRSRPCTPLQKHRPFNSGIDPFGVASVNIDRDAWTLIHYYMTVVDPLLWLWPTGTATNDKDVGVMRNSNNVMVERAFHDQLAMYCLLVMSATRLKYADDLATLEATSNENEYMGKALTLMQDRINEEALSAHPDYCRLFGHMLFLSCAEAFRGNPLAARTHFKACLDLLAAHGMAMSDVAQDSLQGTMIILDQFFGCLDLQKCLYTYETVTVGELALQWSEIHASISDLEPMAFSFSTYPFTSTELSSLISKIKETHRISRSLKEDSMSSSRSIEANLWVRARYRAIRSDLLSTFAIPHSQLSPSSIESIRSLDLAEIAVRIALILFTFLTAKTCKSVTFGEPLGRQLQRFAKSLLCRPYLYSTSMPHGIDWKPLVLWILVIGFTCAADGGETEEWFEQQASELMHTSLGFSNESRQNYDNLFQRLEHSQITFFYHATLQKPYLKRLVERHMANCRARKKGPYGANSEQHRVGSNREILFGKYGHLNTNTV